MEKSNFDRLLERYLSGDVTDEEKIKLEAWLEIKKSSGDENLELSRRNQEKLFKQITQKAGIETPTVPVTNPIFSIPRILAIAASILLLITVSFWMWKVPPTQSETTSIEKLILNDGTIVWLKDQAKLTYLENPETNIRIATLKGEALFEVTKDPSRPFVIQSEGLTVRVLGTSFSLKTAPQQLELVVLTGTVNLSSSTNQIGVNITANQKVIYDGKDTTPKPILESEIEQLTQHTEYDMKFSNAALIEVVQRIEKKFEVSIRLSNTAIGKCKITADLTDHSLATTLETISEVLNLKTVTRETVITLEGEGCSGS